MSKTQFLTLITASLLFFSLKSFAFQYEIIHYDAGTIDQTAFEIRTNSLRKVALVKGEHTSQETNTVKEFINGSWVEINTAEFGNDPVLSIDLSPEGDLLIASSNGLFRQKDGLISTILLDYNIDLVQINPFDGSIYFVEESVLYKVIEQANTVEIICSNLMIDEIQFRSESDLLIKSGNNLYEYSNNLLEERYVPGGMKYWSMDQNNRLWIITTDNQFLKENDYSNYWEIPIFSDHLVIEGTTSMAVDKEGNIWMANEDEYSRLMKWEPGTENALMISSSMLYADEEHFIIDKVISDDEGNIYLINNEKETLIELSYSNPVLNTNEQNNISWSFGPNPAQDILNIKFESSFDTASLEILDQTGRIVGSTSLDGQQNKEINISYLRPGFYFLQFRNKGTLAIQKFIKL